MIVCEYSSRLGRGATRGRLALTGPPARELAAAVGGVRMVHPTLGTACPEDGATTTVLAFEPLRGSAVDLWWGTSGCQTLDDGSVRTWPVGNPSFWRFQSRFASLERAEQGSATSRISPSDRRPG